MNPSYLPHHICETPRAELRLAFAEAALNCPVHIEAASADASFRSYWRVTPKAKSEATPTFIVMDAPPEREDCAPFIDIATRLAHADLHVPQLLAQDLARGFLLLSDLGSHTLLPHLNSDTVESHYQDALRSILHMQHKVDCVGLPRYDSARLQQEMALLPEWFLQRHLGLTLTADDQNMLQRCFALLEARALDQPQAFVHRDFHSRNLMLAHAQNPPHRRLSIIDFQDAVLGPCSYDLVSLLRDCYICWPEPKVAAWRERFRELAVASGVFERSPEQFAQDFDFMGLQRHIKVLGIFARLNYRDGKSGYLRDLPLVLDYTLSVADRYQELQEFAQWLRAKTCAVALDVVRLNS